MTFQWLITLCVLLTLHLCRIHSMTLLAPLAAVIPLRLDGKNVTCAMDTSHKNVKDMHQICTYEKFLVIANCASSTSTKSK